jgi:hypothetical protein
MFSIVFMFSSKPGSSAAKGQSLVRMTYEYGVSVIRDIRHGFLSSVYFES